MRDLKFRAWDAVNQQIIYPKQDIFSGLLTDGQIIDRFEYVMQYTGLKDKNGKEIYEGDIILFYEANGEAKFHSQIRYFQSSCSFIMSWQTLEPHGRTVNRSKALDANMFGEDGFSITYVEVIGNIYEHKHLLP